MSYLKGADNARKATDESGTFSALTDPRIHLKTRHRLIDIIVITICGTICGADNWTEIVGYANYVLARKVGGTELLTSNDFRPILVIIYLHVSLAGQPDVRGKFGR